MGTSSIWFSFYLNKAHWSIQISNQSQINKHDYDTIHWLADWNCDAWSIRPLPVHFSLSFWVCVCLSIWFLNSTALSQNQWHYFQHLCMRIRFAGVVNNMPAFFVQLQILLQYCHVSTVIMFTESEKKTKYVTFSSQLFVHSRPFVLQKSKISKKETLTSSGMWLYNDRETRYSSRMENAECRGVLLPLEWH